MSANIKPVTIENVRELLELSFAQPVLFYFYSNRTTPVLWNALHHYVAGTLDLQVGGTGSGG